MKRKVIQFKWTISRGRDTYGYNICSLYVDGNKVTGCTGGGYDMQGTCFGNWLEKEFAEGIKTLDIKEYYGINEYEGKRYLNGACGFDSMKSIANGLGYKLTRLPGKDDIYLFEKL